MGGMAYHDRHRTGIPPDDAYGRIHAGIKPPFSEPATEKTS